MAEMDVRLVLDLGDTARLTMRVDESGRDRHARRVDHARACGREVSDVGIGADREEASVLYRERLGAGSVTSWKARGIIGANRG